MLKVVAAKANNVVVLLVDRIDAFSMAEWAAAGVAGFGIDAAVYKPGASPARVGI